jgi:hypothetical protein
VATAAQVQEVYATHDSTASSPGPEFVDRFREVWADVKTPGDGRVTPGIGRHYSVGTVEVRTTQNATFSGQPAEPVTTLGTFVLGPGQRRQVVMIQCTSADLFDPAVPQDFQRILWQKYYYGSTADVLDRASNARAIAVWPTLEDETTRVVVCGETYDQQLPLAGLAFPSFLAATAQAPTGFIAVLNGAGDLLWSHHVYGVDPANSCAITDVSIRVEPDGREVVTYCGISSHGDPGPGTSLTAQLAPGFVVAPAGTWTGIVGRVSRTTAGLQPVEFHTATWLVSAQEGLFGLAEIEVDYSVQPPLSRFVVVGATGASAPPGQSGIAYTFDATGTRAATPLVLEGFTFLGDNLEANTIARDVVLLPDGYATGVGTQQLFAIVGSTSDADLFVPGATPLPWAPPTPLAGATDGFLMMATDGPAGPVLQGGVFYGGPGDDGFTGAQSWSEYPDQIVAAGFTQGPEGGTQFDIGVASYYLVSNVTGVPPSGIRLVRQGQVGGVMVDPLSPAPSADERPAGMGLINATTVGLPFAMFGLGDPAGGGVAVDQRARVNVVGYTDSIDFPGIGFTGTVGRGRDPAPPADAVRVVVDMLPPALAGQPFGVGRTDGSGSQGTFVLLAGMSGGTTPLCALSSFGRLLGNPVPTLSRILLDYEGDVPMAGVLNGAILVSRPSNLTLAAGLTAWQWDLPGAMGTPTPGVVLLPPLINGVEVFATQAFVSGPLVYAGVMFPGHSLRVPVNFAVPLPLPAQAMTVQVFCLFPGNPQPGGLTCDLTLMPPDTTEMTASGAMWLPL